MRKLTKAVTNVADAELYAYEGKTSKSYSYVSPCSRNHGSITSIQKNNKGEAFPRYNGYVTCGHTDCYTRMKDSAEHTVASQGYNYYELYINGIPYGGLYAR